MSSSRRFSWLVSAILIASSATLHAEKVDLSWKFKAGDQSEYVLVRNRTAKLDLNGNEISIGVNSTVDMHFVVKGIEENKATLALTIDRIQLTVDSPIELVEYDSAGLIPGEDSSLWPSLKDRVEALVGSETTVIVDTKGKVSDVKFTDKVTEALSAESVNPQVSRFMAGVFDVAGIKAMIKQVFVPLPDGSSDIGTEWKSNEEVDRPPFGKVLVDRKLTYVGRDEGAGNFDSIAVATQVTFEKNEGENAEEIDLKISEQEGKGNVEFDADAGRTREMEFSQKMKMDIVFSGNDVVQNIVETAALKQGKSDPYVPKKKEEPAAEPAKEEPTKQDSTE
jgi:hypothetical protein